MLASSSTISRPHAVHRPTTILLRGTREGELTAALSTSSSAPTPHATRSERPPLFTWTQLQQIISSGNLQNLSRHPDDLSEYFAWMDSVKASYGSVTNFLLSERFTATKLLETASSVSSSSSSSSSSSAGKDEYFKSTFRVGHECQVLKNDWPYSIPRDVTHHVVWSYRPILHPALIPSSPLANLAWGIIAKRGLCGTLTPNKGLITPTLAQHSSHLPDLPLSTLSREETIELETVIQEACTNLVEFIAGQWDLGKVEVAFFANPPSLQSVPSLAHFHVLIKQISA